MHFSRKTAVLFQFVFTSFIDVSLAVSKIGRISGGLHVYAGEMLQLFCVLDVTEYTAHNISFSAVYLHEEEATYPCRDMTHVRVHNASTAILSIPNIYKTGIAQVTCLVGRQCSDADVSNTDTFVDSINVRIGYRPQRITNFTCVVFNWENLNCTWQHPVQYNVDLNDTRVSLVYNSDQTLILFTQCPQLLFDGCFWSSIAPPISTFKILVNVTNSFTGDANTSSFDVDTSKIVKPAPVIALSLTELGDQEDCYLLSWQHTKEFFDAVCQVFHKRPGNSDYELRQDNISKTNSTICELRPNTSHKFFVQCYPGGDFSGYWSDKTYIDYSTPEAAPTKGPEISNGSYSASCMNDLLSVTIFWKNVEKSARNGVIKKYAVKLERQVLFEVDSDSYSATVNMPCHKLPIDLEIAAVNSAGESTKPSVIRVPPLNFQVSLQIEESFAVALNEINTKARAMWDQTDDKNSNYTVFWCFENTISHCKGPIYWMHVPRSQSYLDIPELSANALDYNFGIARTDDDSGLTSGIHWTDCLFYSQPSSLPSPAIVNVQPDTESAVVMWQKVQCTKKSLVLLTGYRVMWCQQQKCSDSSSVQNVDLAATSSFFKVSRLEANTIYKVAVLGKNHDQLGQQLLWKEVTPKPAGSIVPTIVGSISAVLLLAFSIAGLICYRRCQMSRKRTKELRIEDSKPAVLKDGSVPGSPSVILQINFNSSDSRSDIIKEATKVQITQSRDSSSTAISHILSDKLNTSLNDFSDFYELDSLRSRGLSEQHGISLPSLSTNQSQEPVSSYTRIAANSFSGREKIVTNKQELSIGYDGTNFVSTVMDVIQNEQVAEISVGSNERKSLHSDHVAEYVIMEQGDSQDGMLLDDARAQRISGLSLVPLDTKLPSDMAKLPLHSKSENNNLKRYADISENTKLNIDGSEHMMSNPVIREFENNSIEAFPYDARSNCLDGVHKYLH